MDVREESGERGRRTTASSGTATGTGASTGTRVSMGIRVSPGVREGRGATGAAGASTRTHAGTGTSADTRASTSNGPGTPRGGTPTCTTSAFACPGGATPRRACLWGASTGTIVVTPTSGPLRGADERALARHKMQANGGSMGAHMGVDAGKGGRRALGSDIINIGCHP